MKNKEKRIEISEEIDIAEATFEAATLAEMAGFDRTKQFMIATAVSELVRNILRYAVKGEVTIRVIDGKSGKGVEIIAEDNGPGIEDAAQAMKDYFSTSGSLGLGLPGVKRLMDEFVFDSERRIGTKITARKWLKR